MKTAYVQHQRATNDVNGNPRRLFYVTVHAAEDPYMRTIAVIDEGYSGRPYEVTHEGAFIEIREERFRVRVLPSVDILDEDYARLIEWAEKAEVLA